MDNLSNSPSNSKHTNESETAFNEAIKTGRLSAKPENKNYVGKYMYMGKTRDGKAASFKNIDTREYLPR